MTDDRSTLEEPVPDLDERAIARKYGLRELAYPDSEHVKTFAKFLSQTLESGKCGVVPKTAVMMLIDFLQGTLNRQHITKGPRMSQQEFDVLQTPYYLAARVITKITRDRQERDRSKMYQTTYITLNSFLELLHSLVDPGCYWLRAKIPEGVREVMEVLLEFAEAYPEQRRKGRAT